MPRMSSTIEAIDQTSEDGSGLFPDQRVVGEVGGVAEGLAGAVGAGRPGGPEEEGGLRAGVGRVRHEAGRDRHGVAPVPEQRRVVRDQRREGRHLAGREHQRAGGLVVPVLAELGGDLGLDPAALAGRERDRITLREAGGDLGGEAAGQAGRHEANPVERVGRPVRRRGRRRGPNRAGLLATAGEVLALSGGHVLGGEDHLARRRDGAGGDGRLVLCNCAPPKMRTVKQATMMNRVTARAFWLMVLGLPLCG